jgi:parallel beta-helix repeat protein
MNVTIANCNVYGNSAYDNGGGIYLYSADGAVLTGNRVFSNTTGNNGGGLSVSWSDDPALTGNAVFSNTSSYHGGGIQVNGCDGATLTDNDIVGNQAGADGGGISLSRSDDAALVSNRILGNGANRGGGVYLFNSEDATLTNNVVAENWVTSGTGDGAGGCVSASTARFLHTTMARNRVEQGQSQGIRVSSGATLWMTNTILVGHTVGIEVAPEATATLSCTLWGTGEWANADDWEVSGTLVTGSPACNLWGEPGFLDPERGDYHIRADSDAVDTGVDAGVTVDIDGDSRPFYDGYDIGADEFTIYRVFLPLVQRSR